MNRRMKRIISSVMISVGVATTAVAEVPTVEISEAWSRASIGMNRPGGAYLTIRNSGDQTETVTGLRTDIAMMSEIHLSSTNDQGVSSMSPAGEISIAPGDTVALEPGGLHAMLMKLQRPMVEGQTFSLTLILANGNEVTVDVPILGVSARGPDH